MVGMISCVVLDFPWGQTGAPTKISSQELFSGAAPDKFSLFSDLLR
jgi:hypothetical protein